MSIQPWNLLRSKRENCVISRVIRRKISLVNRDEELERAIALVPRKKSTNGEAKEGGEPDDEYDPHLYRKVAHPTS